jgi:hypothetical protein
MLVWGEAAFDCLGPMNQRTAQSFPIAGELFQWSVECKAEDLSEGSLGRAIFDAAERGDVPHETCGMIIHQYVAAGMDSTITALGNAISLLATHPEQFDLMRRDRSLIPAAFNEIMRYESPIHAFGRFVTEDFEIDSDAGWPYCSMAQPTATRGTTRTRTYSGSSATQGITSPSATGRTCARDAASPSSRSTRSSTRSPDVCSASQSASRHFAWAIRPAASTRCPS